MTEQFIYITREITFNNIKIPRFSVGILNTDNKTTCLINFVHCDSAIPVPREFICTFNPEQVGDLFPNKVCNVCHRFLPTTNFCRNQNGKGDRPIRRPSCDECRKIIDGVHLSAQDKKEWEKKKPNYEMFTCPICHKKTIPGLTSKVVLDHDHQTGRPRAWICDSCNTGIGRFKDDTKLLTNAIKYLQTT